MDRRSRDEPLELGAYEGGIVRSKFTATIDGRTAVICLDGSAVFRLAEDADEDAKAHLLNLHRARIREAAERLFRRGIYQDLGSTLEIVITAEDLD